MFKTKANANYSREPRLCSFVAAQFETCLLCPRRNEPVGRDFRVFPEFRNFRTTSRSNYTANVQFFSRNISVPIDSLLVFFEIFDRMERARDNRSGTNSNTTGRVARASYNNVDLHSSRLHLGKQTSKRRGSPLHEKPKPDFEKVDPLPCTPKFRLEDRFK